jgi:hypothetical protein
VFLASAYVEAARLAEAEGQRARAIEMYRLAAGVSGAEPGDRDAARAALARHRSDAGAVKRIARGA